MYYFQGGRMVHLHVTLRFIIGVCIRGPCTLGSVFSIRSMHISFLFQIIRYIKVHGRVWRRRPCTLVNPFYSHITFLFQIIGTRILAIIQFYSSITSLNRSLPPLNMMGESCIASPRGRCWDASWRRRWPRIRT